MSEKLYARVEGFKADPEDALRRLAMPIIAGMFIQILYNLTDTAFIGRLGIDALAAATFSFPLFFLFIAVGNMISVGATPLIARSIGARRKGDAEAIAGQAVILSIALSIVVMVVGLATEKHLFRLMGASEEVARLGVLYMLPLFIGSVFIFLSGAFAAILVGEGNTKLPTYIRIVSALLNIALDYVFIFVFGWGILGASVATALAFVLEVAAFSYFIFVREHTHLRLRARRPTREGVWAILRLGIPTSIAQVLMSLSFLFFNGLFARFGTAEVAAYGLVGRVDSLMFMPLMGLSVALVTLVGMFYGAKRYDLIVRALRASLKYGYLYVLPLGLILWLFPEPIFRILTDDVVVIAEAARLQRIGVFAYPLIVLGFLLGRSLQGLGDALSILVILGSRLIIVAVPLGFLFISLGYGPGSVLLALVIASAVSTVIALFWTRWRLSKVKRELAA